MSKTMLRYSYKSKERTKTMKTELNNIVEIKAERREISMNSFEAEMKLENLLKYLESAKFQGFDSTVQVSEVTTVLRAALTDLSQLKC